MEDYWNKQGETNGTAITNGETSALGNGEPVAPAMIPIDEDVDMIE